MDNKELILLGDTNCDLFNRVAGLITEGNAKHICNLYELFSFTQLIEELTRVTLSLATIIDHIAATCPKEYYKSRGSQNLLERSFCGILRTKTKWIHY